MQNEIIKLCHFYTMEFGTINFEEPQKNSDMHQFHAMTVEICLKPLSKVITSCSGAASGKLMTNPPGPQVLSLDKQTESVRKTLMKPRITVKKKTN